MKIPSTINDLTEAQKTLLPTEEDIVFYETYGWYASPIILSDKLIEEGIIGANEFYKGKRDFQLKSNDGIADEVHDPLSSIRNNEFITLQKKELQNIGFHPLISAIAAKLARTDEIKLFADSLVNKLPTKPTSKGVVGWHSDKAYWPTCTSNKMLTAWIPLQDCTEDMGPLMHIDKSSQWKDEKELKTFFSFNNQDLEKFETYLKEHKPAYKTSFMSLKKGQVSFHNCNTIHSSYPNVSTKERLALAIHLQDANNKYQKVYKDNGEQIVIGYDKICAKDSLGNPDYSDPNLFPVLYSERI
ncbi:phytanoyl-CoA dioxygenase family protein [Flavicella sediminum]|uniref:phytanoyl-CoA dioxygenase family protein n=1 Tax=Flavicella sediminum TaxID=2585141 RepID=UPI0011242C38|nr:phytanoyl-CoA dioxygenase family protein [Flavicella sediminum]